MIINNLANYKYFVSNENSRTIKNKAQSFSQILISDFLAKKELSNNDNSLTLCYDLNRLSSTQNCAIGKEKNEDATQNTNDKITENVEEAKDIFTICFECENKEECEHYQKMINGDESVKGNAVFSPIKTSKSFHKNKVTEQEQLYKLTSSSIIYNYNILCPDIDTKTKKEKR